MTDEERALDVVSRITWPDSNPAEMRDFLRHSVKLGDKRAYLARAITAALHQARREGAEAMRERAAVMLEESAARVTANACNNQDDHTAFVLHAKAKEVRALEADAPAE